MNQKYHWYYCDAVQGDTRTIKDARRELNRHLDFSIYSAVTREAYTGEGITFYFYASQAEADNDSDGAYTPSITRREDT